MFDKLIEIVRQKFGGEYVQALMQRAKTWLLEEFIAYLEHVLEGRKAQTVQIAM
jgi:hypothetical protein